MACMAEAPLLAVPPEAPTPVPNRAPQRPQNCASVAGTGAPQAEQNLGRSDKLFSLVHRTSTRAEPARRPMMQRGL
jgi:hypothetical protein